MTSTPSTISLDTELSAVNSILGSIGQAPVSTLDFTNLRSPSFIISCEKSTWMSRAKAGHTTPKLTTNFLLIKTVTFLCRPTSSVTTFTTVKTFALRTSLSVMAVSTTRLNTPMYSLLISISHRHSYEFNDLPSVFKRYITYRAAGRAATQLIANPQLVQLLAAQEAQAKAACIEYECDMGDHNFMGFPDGSSYTAYEPHHALRR